jgi:hypothetical protein
LKIHHALKETSYLTDRQSMTGSSGMATTIGNFLLGNNPENSVVYHSNPINTFAG